VQPEHRDTHEQLGGFAGIIANPTPKTLLAAHRSGYFPQAHIGPQKWWTREQRYVQFLHERRIPKTVRYEMRKSSFRLTFDRAFDEVIAACAEPRKGRPQLTWVTPKIMHLYAALHDMGHAHSFEVWDETGALVGGGYGVAVGRIFITESLFSRASNTSKLGLQFLNYHLESWGFVLNDVKDFAPHFEGVGSRHISQAEYTDLLAAYADVSLPPNANVCPWTPHATLAEIAKATVNPPVTSATPSSST
jgi:leucyl/phenylalanyl-tRNA---protein transferase